MAPDARHRPGQGGGADDLTGGPVKDHGTSPHRHTIVTPGECDRRLDRLAEDLAVSLCFCERDQLARVGTHMGGHAEVARILGSVRQRWADLAVAAVRVLDEHADALIAADRPDLLAALAGVDRRDLESWVSWADPAPFVNRVVAVLRWLDRVQTTRGYAQDAFCVWADLDDGRTPDVATWRRLRAGVDALLELGGVA